MTRYLVELKRQYREREDRNKQVTQAHAASVHHHAVVPGLFQPPRHVLLPAPGIPIVVPRTDQQPCPVRDLAQVVQLYRDLRIELEVTGDIEQVSGDDNQFIAFWRVQDPALR